jgi:hypothetical protein
MSDRRQVLAGLGSAATAGLWPRLAFATGGATDHRLVVVLLRAAT